MQKSSEVSRLKALRDSIPCHVFSTSNGTTSLLPALPTLLSPIPPSAIEFRNLSLLNVVPDCEFTTDNDDQEFPNISQRTDHSIASASRAPCRLLGTSWSRNFSTFVWPTTAGPRSPVSMSMSMSNC
ncbi:hypothetical protein WAI453_009889 [Rhynchosporium graminicola]